MLLTTESCDSFSVTAQAFKFYNSLGFIESTRVARSMESKRQLRRAHLIYDSFDYTHTLTHTHWHTHEQKKGLVKSWTGLVQWNWATEKETKDLNEWNKEWICILFRNLFNFQPGLNFQLISAFNLIVIVLFYYALYVRPGLGNVRPAGYILDGYFILENML